MHFVVETVTWSYIFRDTVILFSKFSIDPGVPHIEITKFPKLKIQ